MKAGNPTVVGLDLSLTSTGVSDGRHHQAVQPRGLRGEERLERIRSEVFGIAGGAGLVVIEGMAYGRGAQAGHSELAGLHWLIRWTLHRARIPFAVVPPTALKLAVAGKGNASKPEMVAAVDAAHGTDFASVRLSHGRYDMADAFALAAVGYAHISQPLDGERYKCSADWPELICM